MLRGPWYGRALIVAGLVCALLPALAMRGFTVDDALISLRYASHPWRFNVHGPVTDGVTPLPWVPLLALFTGDDLLVALGCAQALGIAAWAAAGAVLGRSLRQAPPLAALGGLATVALAFPIGAWAASGMETGLVLALATVAACDRSPRGAAWAGLAAAFRPELVVWAAVASARRERLAMRMLLAVGPFVLVVAIRLAVFHAPAPLAVSAKPSDLEHGLVYAGAASLVLLTPILALHPGALRQPLALAALAHLVVVIAVGGDWMPYARLVVPIAPGLVLVLAETASSRRAVALRLAVAFALGLLFLRAAPAGRHVVEDRRSLVIAARPHLANARRVAALDIGWLGAATDADIVDLAGLTDPAFAYLPGGHTSKRVDTSMLLDRDVDTVVVYAPLRAVEARLVRSELFVERYEPFATAPLGAHGLYTFYRRR